MKEFKQIFPERINEENLYQKRAEFIKENYPTEESDYDIEDLLADSLDGKEVIEKRDKNKDIEGVLTYEIAQDHENIPYCSLGIALTREESRGEGVMKELFEKAKSIAEEKSCEYMTGIADTLGGEEFMLNNGFYLDTDKITEREYLRLDLE